MLSVREVLVIELRCLLPPHGFSRRSVRERVSDRVMPLSIVLLCGGEEVVLISLG